MRYIILVSVVACGLSAIVNEFQSLAVSVHQEMARLTSVNRDLNAAYNDNFGMQPEWILVDYIELASK